MRINECTNRQSCQQLIRRPLIATFLRPKKGIQTAPSIQTNLRTCTFCVCIVSSDSSTSLVHVRRAIPPPPLRFERGKQRESKRGAVLLDDVVSTDGDDVDEMVKRLLLFSGLSEELRCARKRRRNRVKFITHFCVAICLPSTNIHTQHCVLLHRVCNKFSVPCGFHENANKTKEIKREGAVEQIVLGILACEHRHEYSRHNMMFAHCFALRQVTSARIPPQ